MADKDGLGGGRGTGPRAKGLLAGAGALVLALAGAWLGIDLTGGGGDGGRDGGGSGDASSATGATTADDASGGSAAATGASGEELCPLGSLPPQADDVVDRILTNQDHLYAGHDGKHFGNYEGVLPRERGDYYREYTVDTPGLGHRGARRIVVGGGTEDDPDVWYYTDDHFESFCEIPDAED